MFVWFPGDWYPLPGFLLYQKWFAVVFYFLSYNWFIAYAILWFWFIPPDKINLKRINTHCLSRKNLANTTLPHATTSLKVSTRQPSYTPMTVLPLRLYDHLSAKPPRTIAYIRLFICTKWSYPYPEAHFKPVIANYPTNDFNNLMNDDNQSVNDCNHLMNDDYNLLN